MFSDLVDQGRFAYHANMTRRYPTKEAVRITKTSRWRLEAWVRDGVVAVPRARPLLWGDDELLAAALVAAFTDAGAPLEAVRGLQALIREAGSAEELRAARLVVVLRRGADVEAAGLGEIPYQQAQLVRSDAALEELARSAIQTLVVVDAGKILDALEEARGQEAADVA